MIGQGPVVLSINFTRKEKKNKYFMSFVVFEFL